MNNFIHFVEEIRKNAGLYFFEIMIVLFFLLDFNIKEKAANPQGRKKPHRPNLKKGSADTAHGIIFGKCGSGKSNLMYDPIENEGMIGIFGQAGTGKTTAFAIPSINSACADPKIATCFVIDISGDISKNCPIPEKIVFDIDDENTLPYNVFKKIDETAFDPEKIEQLRKLAFLLMPDIQSANKDDASAFFRSHGRNILIGALIAYYHEGLDFCEICHKIHGMDSKDLLYDIVRTENENAIQYIASFSGTNSKNTAGAKQAMDQAIELFATNYKVRRSLRRPKPKESCIFPDQLEQKSIFLCIPDHELDTLAPLLGIISAQALDYMAARPNYTAPTILFLLDEFASLRIGTQDILNAVRKYRKKNVRICLITQSLTDLDLLYGRDVRTALIDNLRYKVILGISSPDTQKYFADMIGMNEIRSRSASFTDKNITQTYSAKKEYLVNPEDLGRLKDELIVISADGYIRLRKNYFYK